MIGILSEAERRRLDEDQLSIARDSALEEVVAEPREINTIGGCSQLSLPSGAVASAAICLDGRSLKVLAESWALVGTDMEYQAGYLAYREGPVLIKAIDTLPIFPDVLLVPASGTNHPRGIGMARHIGYLLSLPTVGVTRRPLQKSKEGAEKDYHPFSTGPGRGTIYISRGWGMDCEASVEVVRSCMRNHRMPEPIHMARTLCHRIAERMGIHNGGI